MTHDPLEALRLGNHIYLMAGRPAQLEKITELPDNELEMIELRYFEQRPFKEISELLNISESNAKVKIHRIIKKLKMAV